MMGEKQDDVAAPWPIRIVSGRDGGFAVYECARGREELLTPHLFSGDLQQVCAYVRRHFEAWENKNAPPDPLWRAQMQMMRSSLDDPR